MKSASNFSGLTWHDTKNIDRLLDASKDLKLTLQLLFRGVITSQAHIEEISQTPKAGKQSDTVDGKNPANQLIW